MNVLQLNIIVLVIASETILVFGARRRCQNVRIANGNSQMKSRGRIIIYKCSRGYTMLGEGYAACVRGKWDPDPPVCIKPGCPPVRNFKNGHITQRMRSALLEFSCNPGYKLVGPSFIYCDGMRWNTLPPFCKAADISCNFENETPCSWSIEIHDDDDFMWHIQQHESPSRILGTGPKSDHTFSTKETTGHYLIIETSDYDNETSLIPARIHSPKFPIQSDNNTCFIFWYHMFGATVGMLNVFLNNNVAFQERGNHGDRWIKGVIPLTTNGTDLQIMIEGTHGGGITGVIGLDDFSIGTGSECEYSKGNSCEGICNKNSSATAICLCSQECFVDSSCCDDYEQFCGTDSTITTDVEQVYETESSEGTELVSEESVTLSTELIPTDNSNVDYSSTKLDVSSSDFMKDMHKTFSTKESFEVSSTLLTLNDGTTSKEFSKVTGPQFNTLSTKEFNINSETKAHMYGGIATPKYTESAEKDSIINKFQKKITMPVKSSLFFISTNKPTKHFHTLKPFEVVTTPQTITNIISKTFKPLLVINESQIITPRMTTNKTFKTFKPLDVTKFQTTTPVVANKTTKIFNPSGSTIIIPTTKNKISKTYKPLSTTKFQTIKPMITNKIRNTTFSLQNTVTIKPTLNDLNIKTNSSTSPLIKKHATANVYQPTTKNIVLPNVMLTASKQKAAIVTIPPFTTSTLYSHHSNSTLCRQTNQNLPLAIKTTQQPSKLFTHALQNLTSKIPFINPKVKPTMKDTQMVTQTLGFKLTLSPFQVTKNWDISHKTPKEIYNKLTTVNLPTSAKRQTNKIVTHVEKINTTVVPKSILNNKIIKPSNSTNINYTVQLVKSTTTEKYIEETNLKLNEKWHPANTTKEKYQLNSEESSYSDPIGKEIIISSICLATLLVIGTLIPFFIIKRRRRLRFVNDCEGDVLYTSSEEMLDLHLARSVVI